MGRILRIAFFSIVVLAIAYGIMYLIWFDNNDRQGAGVGLMFGYLLLAVGALAVLVASISNIIHNPKSGLSVLVGIVIFVVIALIGYSMSSGEILESYYKKGVDTASYSKFVDAELFLMYGLGIIAFIAVIASEVSAAIKK